MYSAVLGIVVHAGRVEEEHSKEFCYGGARGGMSGIGSICHLNGVNAQLICNILQLRYVMLLREFLMLLEHLGLPNGTTFFLLGVPPLGRTRHISLLYLGVALTPT